MSTYCNQLEQNISDHILEEHPKRDDKKHYKTKKSLATSPHPDLIPYRPRCLQESEGIPGTMFEVNSIEVKEKCLCIANIHYTVHIHKCRECKNSNNISTQNDQNRFVCDV